MNAPDNFSPIDRSRKQRSIGNNLPDLSMYGYQVRKLLSARDDDSKFSYLARHIRSERSVVVKEWRRTGAETPSLDYANYLPEIERLRQIDDPNVAPYLESFQTPHGFCLVREFVAGASLAEIGRLSSIDIKFLGDILLKALDRLHHLQPSIIHQNIKTENIIVNNQDDELVVYLVDFALDADRRRFGGNAFTPADRLFVLDRTPTADLHSLGLALICALTGTPTTKSDALFDDNYRLKFAHLLAERPDPYFTAWLETMVEQNRERRKINTRSNRHRAYENVFVSPPKSDGRSVNFNSTKTQLKIKKKPNWWKLLIPMGLLLGLGLLARQLLWPEGQMLWSEAEEPSPEQIAKNQEIAKKAQYVSSDVGRLLTQKECNRCNFDRQNFAKAELTGANISKSTFNGTNLERANLSLAILSDAELTEANLSNANLHKSAFYGAKFVNTNLKGANLSNAKLLYAKLKGVSLQKANLANSDLKFTELQYVDLSNADLTGADLSNADLSYSNLRNAKLTGAKLDGAIFTGATMPDGKIRP